MTAVSNNLPIRDFTPDTRLGPPVVTEGTVELLPQHCQGSIAYGTTLRGQVRFRDSEAVHEAFGGMTGRLMRAVGPSMQGVPITVRVPDGARGWTDYSTVSDGIGRFAVELATLPEAFAPEPGGLSTVAAEVWAAPVRRPWARRWLGWVPGVADFSPSPHGGQVRYLGDLQITIQAAATAEHAPPLGALWDVDRTTFQFNPYATLRQGAGGYRWVEGMQELATRLESVGTLQFVTASPRQLQPEIFQALEDSGLRVDGGVDTKAWFQGNGQKLQNLLRSCVHRPAGQPLVSMGDTHEADPATYSTLQRILNGDLHGDALSHRLLLGRVPGARVHEILALADRVRSRGLAMAGVWIIDVRSGTSRWANPRPSRGFHLISSDGDVGARIATELEQAGILPSSSCPEGEIRL